VTRTLTSREPSQAVSEVPADLAERNRRLIQHINEWYATPDDQSEDWWDELERELLGNRFRLRECEP